MSLYINYVIHEHYYIMELNWGSHLVKKSTICLIESLSKMMKNALYFILKALSVLKIFKFS